MTRGYVLAPEAALELVQIWRYIAKQAALKSRTALSRSFETRSFFPAPNPGAGYGRKNLTDEAVKFFPVYSYLIVYRPDTVPLQIVSILHGRRDVDQLLRDRL
jgi:plasmid stabilization system protein ParE